MMWRYGFYERLLQPSSSPAPLGYSWSITSLHEASQAPHTTPSQDEKPPEATQAYSQ